MTNTTQEQLFVQYCDSTFGKVENSKFTAFEHFPNYWKIFQFAFENGWCEGHEKGYTLGFSDGKTCGPDTSNYEEGCKEGFQAGYRKGELDTVKEMQQEVRDAYNEGLYTGQTDYRYDRS